MTHPNRKCAFIALFVATCLVAAIAHAADAPAFPGVPQASPETPPPVAKPSTAEPFPLPKQQATPVAGSAPAVPNSPKESLNTLAKKIERAQQCSPEVLIAEAQLREAEAKLQQARLQAAERVTQGEFDRIALGKMRENLALVQESWKAGRISQQELAEAEARLNQIEANVAKQEVYLEMLTESVPDTPHAAQMSVPVPVHGKQMARPKMPEEFSDRLQVQGGDPIAGRLTVEELASLINAQFSLNMVVDIQVADQLAQVNMQGPDTTLAGILTAIADSANVCFVVRDYGVFLTSREQAATIVAPTIPEDVPLYGPPSEELFAR